jgi:hypothetical protein
MLFCDGKQKEDVMPKDLTITGFEDEPGINASIGAALGAAGVNIDGTFGSGKLREIHVLVEDVAAARRAVEDAGFQVSDERDVLLLEVENRPGAWGDAARKLADAGVNIEFNYVDMSGRQVVAVDDLKKARGVV